jgi:hypothetical protein
VHGKCTTYTNILEDKLKKIVLLVLIFLTLTSISFANVDGDYYKVAMPEGYDEIEKENQLIVRTFINDENKIRIYNQYLGIHSFRSLYRIR